MKINEQMQYQSECFLCGSFQKSYSVKNSFLLNFSKFKILTSFLLIRIHLHVFKGLHGLD